jgi:hypothetical protein
LLLHPAEPAFCDMQRDARGSNPTAESDKPVMRGRIFP